MKKPTTPTGRIQGRLGDSKENLLSNCVPFEDCMLWKGMVLGSTHVPGLSARVDGKNTKRSARRRMWELKTRKPVPQGKVIGVTCGRPMCMVHLCLTDKSEIAQETNARADVRAAIGAGNRKRHAGKARVNLTLAREIRSSPESHQKTADRFGISKAYVASIRSGKRIKEANPFAGLGG